MAKAFIAETGFSGDLYVDQKRLLYAALDCKRGLKYVATKKTLAAGKQARNEGYAQGKKAGDALQLGGTFVLSRSKGVVFEHQDQFAGEEVPTDQVLQAIEPL